jgi:transporter family-2 protein
MSMAAEVPVRTTLHTFLLYLCPFTSGIGLSIHGGMNGGLGKAYQNPLFAAWINFFVATVCLAVLFGVNINGFFDPNVNPEPQKPWKCTGGFIGAAVVFFVALGVPHLGFVLFFTCMVSGQLSGGMLCDHFGRTLGVKEQRLSKPSAAAAVIVVLGVVLVGLGGSAAAPEGGGQTRNVARTVFYCVLTFISGTLLPVQGIVNHHCARSLRFPLYGTLVSFVGGLLALGIAFLIITVGFEGEVYPKWHFKPEVPAYYYCSGFFGGFFVFTAMFVGPKITMSMCFMLVLLGQMIGSLPLDHYGFLNLPVRKANASRICGLLLALGGVLLNGHVNFQKTGRITGADDGGQSGPQAGLELELGHVTAAAETETTAAARPPTWEVLTGSTAEAASL